MLPLPPVRLSTMNDCPSVTLRRSAVVRASVSALPPARLERVEALARRAYLAGAADGPRSFVAVARLATGHRDGA
jgi:hypothetical protein